MLRNIFGQILALSSIVGGVGLILVFSPWHTKFSVLQIKECLESPVCAMDLESLTGGFEQDEDGGVKQKVDLKKKDSRSSYIKKEPLKEEDKDAILMNKIAKLETEIMNLKKDNQTIRYRLHVLETASGTPSVVRNPIGTNFVVFKRGG